MTVVKGRWGFHPCSYALYLKLKELNHCVLRAKMAAAAWQRWNRKLPENRLLYRHYKTSTHTKKEVIGPAPEPATLNLDLVFANMIYADYRSARFPVSTEVEVKAVVLSEAFVDAMLAKVKGEVVLA